MVVDFGLLVVHDFDFPDLDAHSPIDRNAQVTTEMTSAMGM